MNSSSDSPILEVHNLGVAFLNGQGPLQALEEISFNIQARQFVCIVGPSGSGKSTLLRILGGLLSPTNGEVIFNGSPLKGPRQGVGMVFQNANLMPWRTVIENIALPLEVQGVSVQETQSLAKELVTLVGLSGFEDWLPRDLSGGMAQRVAIARALIHDPDLLLLDEPFGALDALTRERMGSELLRIWRVHRKTVIMVTHNISEAVFLADRVLAISPQPGQLRLDMEVNLPRPRQDIDRYSADFVALTHNLRDALR
ncbi:MAG: ABC transporter [Anaerolinea sp. 4484_236]|nr:MAG: ABC transporter [Anaerolinea sp. 4484_236]RLD11894.1 MAG: ABC transporter ATP-binding protein [Chloroflexota bacterium]